MITRVGRGIFASLALSGGAPASTEFWDLRHARTNYVYSYYYTLIAYQSVSQFNSNLAAREPDSK